MGEVLVLGAVIGIFYLLSKGNGLVTTPLSSTSKLPSLSSLLKKFTPASAAVPLAGGVLAGSTILETTPLVAGGSLPITTTAVDIISQAPVSLGSEGLGVSSIGTVPSVSPSVGASLGVGLGAFAIGATVVFVGGGLLTKFFTGGTENWSAKQWDESRWKLPEPTPLPKYGDVTTLLKSGGVAPSNVLGGQD